MQNCLLPFQTSQVIRSYTTQCLKTCAPKCHPLPHDGFTEIWKQYPLEQFGKMTLSFLCPHLFNVSPPKSNYGRGINDYSENSGTKGYLYNQRID